MTDQQQLFVKMALNAWELNLKRATATFEGFTVEQLFEEVSPGKNRVIYLFGHLIAVHDMMLPLLGFGERKYPHLDEAFISNPDKVIKDLPSAEDLKTYWNNINEILAGHFNNLSAAEWFQKHTMITDEDFIKEPHRNRLSVLITRTNHLSYHLGQVILVKK
jgi:hypothetical protein